MFKFKFLPICRAHSMAVPHPAAFPSAKYTVSPPIFHPTSGYRPGKKISFTDFLWNPLEQSISIACVASVSVRFRSKERGTRVKDGAKNGASKWVWHSFHFSRAAKPENPVPRPFSAPKPNGHVFYASYDFYPDLGSDTSSVWNFCARFSDVISWGNQWWRHEMLTFTQSNEKRLLRFRET